jgi:hypothetical protein
MSATADPPCSACRRKRVEVAYEHGKARLRITRNAEGKSIKTVWAGSGGEKRIAHFCPRCDSTKDWPRFEKEA